MYKPKISYFNSILIIYKFYKYLSFKIQILHIFVIPIKKFKYSRFFFQKITNHVESLNEPLLPAIILLRAKDYKI